LKNGNAHFTPGAATKVEAWQILTPRRNEVLGAQDINRLLHKRFRKDTVTWASRNSDQRGRITPPRGPEEIVYGDKVINVRNHKRKYVTPIDGALAYIANVVAARDGCCRLRSFGAPESGHSIVECQAASDSD